MDLVMIGVVVVVFIGGIVVGVFSKEGIAALSDKLVVFLVKNRDAIFSKLSDLFTKKAKVEKEEEK